jgi:hypothetical protein
MRRPVGCCLGIFDPGRGLDCNDWTGYTVYIARRCDTAPAVDDSQLGAHRCCHHAADLPAPCFRVSLAFCDRLSRHCVVVLDSERDRGGVVPAFCADAFGDKCAGQAGVPAKGVEFSARCEAVRSV